MRNAATGPTSENTPPEPPRARYLHLTRAAQSRYDLPPARFGLHGRVLHLSATDARDWAHRISQGRAGGEGAAPVTAGELLAAVALHELMHVLVAASTQAGAPYAGALARALAATEAATGTTGLSDLAAAFEAAFITASAAGRAGPTGSVHTGSEPAGALLLEELTVLGFARRNPALASLAELYHAPAVTESGAHATALAQVRRVLSRRPADGAWAQLAAALLPEEPGVAPTLYRLLAYPQHAAPRSLAEQLRLALHIWGPLLGAPYGAALNQAARALDALVEEEKRYAGPPAAPPEPVPPTLVGLGEPEAYSQDADWMPGTVLVAKSTYVWLAQLSERYGRPVRTLDDVPDEALAELAGFGFNALWLIGVWWRSTASRIIKRLRGQPDALASAYSVRDYVVAPELGGEEALQRLRERAASHGLRLASDMVPNHTAIDSTWVMERPEWFVQVSQPPYPGYSFTGPDLSTDPRVSIRIEDHYYDGSDAAVVFQRVDTHSGEARYLYHGNDGTALPWNDTAQLDFTQAAVRRAVIDATVDVARRFPLIRLDAAMTLARKHVRRLWHPPPGEGGAVPSRAALALSQAEFDALMPGEFWRELVDEVAERAPGTMLLAEAFWLMEVYFVRSLGMNRVYNSAFMHMTMNEDNAGYRRYLKRFLEQAPQVLARFVNYMSNPDEESAAEQFGTGDKAFGVATLMATLPGLPMFGHGQVEGLAEKYGMEFARPRTNEAPLDWHVDRHRSAVAPLLRRRRLFAGSERFRLYDLVLASGGVAEDAFVFSNGHGSERALVAYNNSPRAVAGRVKLSAPTLRADGAVVSEDVAAALGVEPGAESGAQPGVVVLTDMFGVELRLPAEELLSGGLPLELAPYEARVFLAVRTEPEVTPEEALPRGRRRSERRAFNLALTTGRRGVAARRRRARHRR